MAPRRGGGAYGSSSGGSAGCEDCNQPLQLSGSEFTDPSLLAVFVITCISLFMVVICLFGAPFYSRWRAANGRSGKYGLGTYLGAVILAVINLSLSVANTALYETDALVTRSYYVIYVFILASGVFWELLTLILVAQFVDSALPTRRRAFTLTYRLAAFILSLLAIALICVDIAVTASNISLEDIFSAYTTLSLAESLQAIYVTFDSIVLLTLLVTLAVLLKHFRSLQQTNSYRTVTLLAILTYAISWVFAVASDAIYLSQFIPSYSDYFDFLLDSTTQNFLTASGFIQIFGLALTLVFCFGLAYLGSRGPSNVNPDGYVYTKPSRYAHNRAGNTGLNP